VLKDDRVGMARAWPSPRYRVYDNGVDEGMKLMQERIIPYPSVPGGSQQEHQVSSWTPKDGGKEPPCVGRG